MTTVIGIKSSDGVVLASDSQYSTQLTKDIGSKIYGLHKNQGMGGSGVVDQMNDFAAALKEKLSENMTSVELKDGLEKITLEFHKKYNVGWSNFLELPNIVMHFNPTSIVGAKLKDGSFGLYKIYFYQDRFWVSNVDNFESIGSGSLYAKLILKQQSRPMLYDKINFSNMPLNYNVWIACLSVNEAKAYDLHSGGNTEVAIVTKHGFRMLSSNQVKDFYGKFTKVLHEEFSKKLGLSEDQTKNLIPKL